MMIALGGAIGAGIFKGSSSATDHGGFLPNGIFGTISAMIVVVFSYGGTEMIGVTLAETQQPEKVIPKAVRSTFSRIVTFYVLPFLIIVSLIPWNQVNPSKEIPFVTVFDLIGVPYVGHVMNAVMLTAVLSAMNTGMYAASRMLYTQSTDGRAWSLFSKLSMRQVPVYAILEYLCALLGRKNTTQLTGYYVKFFPYTTWISLVSIIAIFIGVRITTPQMGTVVTLGIFVLIGSFSFFKKRSVNASTYDA